MLYHRKNDLPACQIKFKTDGNDKTLGKFSGLASVFDGKDAYGDTIKKGAFAKTLESGKRPLMYFNHNPSRVIGKWLKIEETQKGLEVTGELTPGHSDAQNVKASMQHGAMDGLSIGFYIPKGGSERKDDGSRVISQINLIEISVVSRPADDHARISQIKSQIEEIQNIRDAERFLRDSGLSKSAAMNFASRFKEIVRSDSVQQEEIAEDIKTANTDRVIRIINGLNKR